MLSVRFARWYSPFSVQRLQDRRIGEHHSVDGLEVLRRNLPAEWLERARVCLVTLAQGFIGDVRKDRREIGGGFGAAREELRPTRRALERQVRDARHIHPARIESTQLQVLLRHVEELEIAVLARHVRGPPLLLGPAAIEVFAEFVAVMVPAPRHKEPVVGAQQQRHLHAGEALLPAVAAGADLGR